MKIIKVNKGKKVNSVYGYKNRLIIFTYYLRFFFTLSHTIKLFYQIYLIYLMT